MTDAQVYYTLGYRDALADLCTEVVANGTNGY